MIPYALRYHTGFQPMTPFMACSASFLNCQNWTLLQLRTAARILHRFTALIWMKKNSWLNVSTSNIISQILASVYSVDLDEKEFVAECQHFKHCLLYTSDAADEEDSVDLGGRRIIKKK